jgi:hypothetical protein
VAARARPDPDVPRPVLTMIRPSSWDTHPHLGYQEPDEFRRWPLGRPGRSATPALSQKALKMALPPKITAGVDPQPTSTLPPHSTTAHALVH